MLDSLPTTIRAAIAAAVLLNLDTCLPAGAQVTVEDITPLNPSAPLVTVPPPDGQPIEGDLTPLETRWLPRFATLQPMRTPVAAFSQDRLHPHPRLLREWVRIFGVSSIGHWTRDEQRIAEAFALGVPVAMNWSPNEVRQVTIRAASPLPAGGRVISTLLNGDRVVEIPDVNANLDAFRAQCARVAKFGSPTWLLIDSEREPKRRAPRELLAYHDDLLVIAHEHFGDAFTPCFYGNGQIAPSNAVHGYSLARTTTGLEPGPINVSLYMLYDFGFTQSVLEKSVFHGLARGNTQVVAWLGFGGSYVVGLDKFGTFKFGAESLVTPEIMYQVGARLGHPWLRADAQRERYGPWGRVGLAVLYPGLLDPRVVTADDPDWYLTLAEALARGAMLDRPWLQAFVARATPVDAPAEP